jgi:hypothetical protein
MADGEPAQVEKFPNKDKNTAISTTAAFLENLIFIKLPF